MRSNYRLGERGDLLRRAKTHDVGKPRIGLRLSMTHSHAPADGDIVVAHHPHRDFEIIKRVEFVDEGVYLRSDNRDQPDTQDSRSFGLVGLENVWGRVTSVVAENRPVKT